MSTSIYTTNKNECRFNPVQCTWDKFETLTAQEGFVYFVTDKKKLFLGKNKEMIPMCASSGIFYGKKPVEYENSGNNGSVVGNGARVCDTAGEGEAI